MISGFNLIQNSISSSQPATTPQRQPIHGFQFIQNSIQGQSEEQEQEQQYRQFLQSMPNSYPNSYSKSYPSEQYQYPDQEEYEDQDQDQDQDKCMTTPKYASTNSNNPNNYITLNFANDTYLTIITAKLTYQTIAGMSAYVSKSYASNTYLSIEDASNIYIPIDDVSGTYLTIIDASNTYLTISNANAKYLTQTDASNTYLYNTLASQTYLTLIEASTYVSQPYANTNYLSRAAGTHTSDATSTSFTGKISVQGATFSCDVSNNKLGINTSITTDTSQIGNGTVTVGSSTTNNNATNAVIVGSYVSGSNNSVAIGKSCGSTSITQSDNVTIGIGAYSNASNCVTIGSHAISNANNCVVIGANALTDASANNSVAIGYNSHATLPYQIVLGASYETVYFSGNPPSGTTPNTCLVLSSNVTLNTLTSTPPISGQLGYTTTLTILLSNNITISTTPTPTIYATLNLGVGTWLITGVITVISQLSQLISGTDNGIFTISMNTVTSSHNTQQLIVYQNFAVNGTAIYTTSSFNYSNVIYNTNSTQVWYILISVAQNSTAINTSNTGAYINATRIA